MNKLSDVWTQLRRRWFYGLIALMVAIGLILGSPQPSQALPTWMQLLIRGVQVIQLSTLSDNQEVGLGRQINQELLAQEFTLYRNSELASYVDQVGQKLARNSTRSEIPYVFQVIDNDALNAFSTMGGYVYVTTELIRTAENEAELASVLGHEIGHIEARHAVEQMREAALAQGLATAAGLDNNAAVSIGVDLAIRRPNSRQAEFEADQLGLSSLKQTGYAPIAMPDFMRKLLGQPRVPEFLSTHPNVSDRIEALNRSIDPGTATVGTGLDKAYYREKIRALL